MGHAERLADRLTSTERKAGGEEEDRDWDGMTPWKETSWSNAEKETGGEKRIAEDNGEKTVQKATEKL